MTRVIEWHGEFVGSVGITPQRGWRSHSAEIGYWLGEDCWGRGIATAALGQMTELACQGLGLRKLFAPVLAPNRASMRILEKNGYRLEGILEGEVAVDDRYLDVYHFARRSR